MARQNLKNEKPWWEKTDEEILKEMNEAVEKALKEPEMTEEELIEYDADYGYDYWED